MAPVIHRRYAMSYVRKPRIVTFIVLIFAFVAGAAFAAAPRLVDEFLRLIFNFDEETGIELN